MNNVYLIWLRWAESCFRANAADLAYFKSLVPAGARVVRARTERAFLRALPSATHVVTWDFRPEWFAKAPRLKVLATPAAGQELVPTTGPEGVRIHFGHYHGEIIAESVLGFMLCWAKGFFAVGHAPRECRAWPRVWLSDRCFDIAGTRAVIAGFGHVGRLIGRRLEAMDVDVYGITRHGVFHGTSSPAPLPPVSSHSIIRQFDYSIISSADWFILALPSNTGTDDYLNAALLRKLPRRCVVVNVGRGNAVDERALVAALKQGRIAGAYLDVCKRERSQIWAKSVKARATGLIDPANPKVPNLVLMPHSAAFSRGYISRAFKELKDDGCL